METDTESSIEAFRRGTPPGDKCRFYLVAHEPFINQVDHSLSRIASGKSDYDIRFLIGEPGAGKTNLLFALEEEVLKNKCAVSYMTVDDRSQIFTKVEIFVTEVFRTVKINVNDSLGNWDTALQAISRSIISESEKQDIPPSGSERTNRLRRHIYDLFEDEEINEPSLIAALLEYTVAYDQYTRGVDSNYEMPGWAPLDRMKLVKRWFYGKSIPSGRLSRIGIGGPINSENAMRILNSSLHTLRKVGIQVIVILADEMELASMQWTKIQRDRSWHLVRRLFDGELHGALSVLALTNNALEDEKRGAYSYEALKSRLSEEGQGKKNVRNLLSNTYRLGYLNQDEMTILFSRILESHKNANNWSGNGVESQVKNIINEISNNSRMLARDFVKASVAKLDNIMSNGD